MHFVFYLFSPYQIDKLTLSSVFACNYLSSTYLKLNRYSSTMRDVKVAVIGAGVVGLTTALEAQNDFKNVEIYADKFYEETTSAVAAGLFRPGTSFAGPTDLITRQWINDAYTYWDDIRKTPDASLAGVTQLSGYIFSSSSPNIVKNQYIEKLVPLYRRATEEELSLTNGNWKHGSFFTTILTDCNLFLPWATRKFIGNGGKILTQNVNNLADVAQNYDVTFNCTGLGAKYLCNDHKLVPMRGQVLKVQAPWIKTFFYGDYDTYVIPGFNSVTLGGCRQYDSYNMKIDKYDTLSIKERCYNFLPSLKNARIISQKVGLRPHRAPVRVENEYLKTNIKTCKVIHNYGHGGYGVTTAPGTAKYAMKLAKEMHMSNSKL